MYLPRDMVLPLGLMVSTPVSSISPQVLNCPREQHRSPPNQLLWFARSPPAFVATRTFFSPPPPLSLVLIPSPPSALPPSSPFFCAYTSHAVARKRLPLPVQSKFFLSLFSVSTLSSLIYLFFTPQAATPSDRVPGAFQLSTREGFLFRFSLHVFPLFL